MSQFSTGRIPMDTAQESTILHESEDRHPGLPPRRVFGDFLPDAVAARIGLATILGLSAALRAWHVRRLIPIMIDETIYLRWAEIIQHQHQFFISLLDGKTPLSFWILAF